MAQPGTIRALSLWALVATAWGSPGLAAQSIRGTVTDPRLGTPVVEALVVMVNESGHRVASVFTDVEGTFALAVPTPGAYMVGVARLGYQQAITPELHVNGTDVDLDIFLPPDPLAVDSITVASARNTPDAGRLRGLLRPERRRGTLVGRLNRSEIEAHGSQGDLIGLLSRMNIPGLSARRVALSPGGPEVAVCVESGRNRSVLPKTRSRIVSPTNPLNVRTGADIDERGSGCSMMAVYLDDLYVADPGDVLASLTPGDLEELEVVPPLESLARFGARASNGALLIWTRRSRK